jgi:spermidine synthase
LVARWEARGLETRLLTPAHIRLKLAERRRAWFWAALGEERSEASPPRARVNRDLHPVGLIYGLSYWNALHSPRLARAFAGVGQLTLWGAILPIAGCGIVLLGLVRRTARAKTAVVPIAVAATGFAGMAAHLITILAFQTLYGYVYGWIGSLIAVFMGGAGLGGLLAMRRLAQGKRVSMLVLEGALVLYWALLPAILGALYTTMDHLWTPTVARWVLLALNGVAGALVGYQFPLANGVWPRGRSPRPGILYACDLAGALCGAIAVSVILVPALGIAATCLLVVLLKAASLTLVAAVPSSG